MQDWRHLVFSGTRFSCYCYHFGPSGRGRLRLSGELVAVFNIARIAVLVTFIVIVVRTCLHSVGMCISVAQITIVCITLSQK